MSVMTAQEIIENLVNSPDHLRPLLEELAGLVADLETAIPKRK